MGNTKPSTRSLVRAYKEGDRQALAELLGRKEGRLLLWIRGFLGKRRQRIDPQDILQEVNLHVVSNLHRFEDRFTGAFARWMEGVAKNKIRNALRKKREEALDLARCETGRRMLERKGETPSESTSRREARENLLAALRSLPDSQKIVLWLRDYEQLSFEEIARKMAKPSAEAAAKFYWRSVEKLGDAYRTQKVPS